MYGSILDSKPSKGYVHHHKNEERRDARKSNIEVMTHVRHEALHSGNTSVGIWQRPSGKWQSQIIVNGKKRSFGPFESKRLAALVYDRDAKKFHGSRAELNFPNLSDAERQNEIELLLKEGYYAT